MAIHKIKFFAGRGSRYLAEKIVASYGTKLGESEVLNFSDGEFQPCFLESIRGCTVFVIQSTFPPTDNLMELLMMIDAAKRASAHQVIAVMPYFGWARQDRKDRPRVPIGAKLVAKSWDDDEMTHDLSAAYQRAALENHALLADVGQRFYALANTRDLYAADGVHPSELGSCIAAETIAAVIRQHKEA